MYTRLYREVLNRCYWAESAESFLNVHEDTGIIGIDGSCEASFVPNLIQVAFIFTNIIIICNIAIILADHYSRVNSTCSRVSKTRRAFESKKYVKIIDDDAIRISYGCL